MASSADAPLTEKLLIAKTISSSAVRIGVAVIELKEIFRTDGFPKLTRYRHAQAVRQDVRTVSPGVVLGVAQRGPRRIAYVPIVFGKTHIFSRLGFGEWRQRRARHVLHSS
jgi:hypothetical protein